MFGNTAILQGSKVTQKRLSLGQRSLRGLGQKRQVMRPPFGQFQCQPGQIRRFDLGRREWGK